MFLVPPRAALALMVAAMLQMSPAARAAEAIFPPGSRVGLVPLDGLQKAASFRGFENTDNGTKVVVAEAPANVFASIDAGLKAGQLPASAIKPELFETASGRKSYLTHETATNGTDKAERFALVISGEGFSGYVAVDVPQAAAQAYPEQAIRKMLASATVRGDVPLQEQLANLPFKVTDTAGFKLVRTLPPGSSVILSDAEGDSDLSGPPYILVAIAPIALGPSDDRGRVARDLAQTIPGLKNMRFTSAEPIRIAGTPGFEVRIEAKTAKDDRDVTLVQWLRFGSGATLRMVAGATREDWAQAFPRFRAVRDGIDPQN